jgi:hypothetical protein
MFRENSSDMLLIADYKVGDLVAESLSYSEILYSLFLYRTSRRPLILIHGLETGNLQLKIVHRDTSEDKEESEEAEIPALDSRQLLLEIGALGRASVGQEQLFDIEAFWTKIGSGDKLG